MNYKLLARRLRAMAEELDPSSWEEGVAQVLNGLSGEGWSLSASTGGGWLPGVLVSVSITDPEVLRLRKSLGALSPFPAGSDDFLSYCRDLPCSFSLDLLSEPHKEAALGDIIDLPYQKPAPGDLFHIEAEAEDFIGAQSAIEFLDAVHLPEREMDEMVARRASGEEWRSFFQTHLPLAVREIRERLDFSVSSMEEDLDGSPYLVIG